MKQYWDYTEKERSEMTEEVVQGFLDTHLMAKGILKVKAPVLLKVEDEPKLPKRAMFECGDILFDTAELAQAFLALSPKKARYDYNVGYDLKYPELVEPKIDQVMMINHQDLLDHSVILKKNKASKEANERASNQYTKDSEAMRKCLDEVWEDYRCCQATARKHSRVMETWNEYLKLTGGDRAMAKSFILKAYNEDEIKEAFDWFGFVEADYEKTNQ